MLENATVQLANHTVLRVGLGGARWSIGDPRSDSDVLDILDRALDLGMNYIDTARAYTTSTYEAHNEKLIARALTTLGRADEVLVATKGGHFRAGDEWPIDGHPESLRRDCAASRRALGVDHLDLYYLHFPDPAVPIEESVGALADLRDAGDVRAVGVCNVTVEQLERAQSVTRIDAVQNPFSPFGASRDVLERATQWNIPFVAYSPLGGTRRLLPLESLSTTANELARSQNLSIETVMLAWVLSNEPGLVAITGASRSATLSSSAMAAEVTLSTNTIIGITADLERVAA